MHILYIIYSQNFNYALDVPYKNNKNSFIFPFPGIGKQLFLFLRVNAIIMAN